MARALSQTHAAVSNGQETGRVPFAQLDTSGSRNAKFNGIGGKKVADNGDPNPESRAVSSVHNMVSKLDPCRSVSSNLLGGDSSVKNLLGTWENRVSYHRKISIRRSTKSTGNLRPVHTNSFTAPTAPSEYALPSAFPTHNTSPNKSETTVKKQEKRGMPAGAGCGAITRGIRPGTAGCGTQRRHSTMTSTKNVAATTSSCQPSSEAKFQGRISTKHARSSSGTSTVTRHPQLSRGVKTSPQPSTVRGAPHLKYSPPRHYNAAPSAVVKNGNNCKRHPVVRPPKITRHTMINGNGKDYSKPPVTRRMEMVVKRSPRNSQVSSRRQTQAQTSSEQHGHFQTSSHDVFFTIKSTRDTEPGERRGEFFFSPWVDDDDCQNGDDIEDSGFDFQLYKDARVLLAPVAKPSPPKRRRCDSILDRAKIFEQTNVSDDEENDENDPTGTKRASRKFLIETEPCFKPTTAGLSQQSSQGRVPPWTPLLKPPTTDTSRKYGGSRGNNVMDRYNSCLSPQERVNIWEDKAAAGYKKRKMMNDYPKTQKPRNNRGAASASATAAAFSITSSMDATTTTVKLAMPMSSSSSSCGSSTKVSKFHAIEVSNTSDEETEITMSVVESGSECHESLTVSSTSTRSTDRGAPGAMDEGGFFEASSVAAPKKAVNKIRLWFCRRGSPASRSGWRGLFFVGNDGHMRL